MKTMLRVFFLILLCSPSYIKAQCPVVDFGPDTVICVGTSITLNAENSGATYLWSDGSTSPQFETFFEGEYSVEVTRDGCVASDTIYVQQGTVIYADFNFVQTTTCSPLVTEFNEYSVACSAAIIDWTWDFGDGTSSNDRKPVHSYSLPGDYLVTLTVKSNKGSIYSAQQTITIEGAAAPVVELGTDVNLCYGNELILSAGNPGAQYNWSTGETSLSISVFDGGKYSVVVTKDGCSSEDSINVTSVPVLWSDFTFQKVSGCMPVKYKFTDKSTSCEGTITNWFWEFGDGETSNSQHPEHDFTSPGQFIVKLTIEDNNGNTIKRSKKVTIEPSSLSVNLGADTTICFGSSLSLDAGNPGFSYLWSTGETSQQISIMDDGDYSVTIGSDGCEASDTINVKTSLSVLNKWSYTKGADCLPVTVDFTDSSEVYCGQAITSWSWDFGDGIISTQQHPKHEYYTADSFIVKLTVTTSGGSNSTSSKKIGISNSTHTVDLPSELKVCSGESVQVDAGVMNAEYNWTPTFGVSAADIRNPLIKPILNTWYTVEVKKCLVSVKDSVYIVVDSIIKPTIKQNGNNLTAPHAFALQWYRDGRKLGNASGNLLRMDRQGFYSVKIFNQSGCGSESEPKFFLPLSGKEKYEDGIRIKCSPNPTRGLISILLSDLPDKPARVAVYDRHGRVLFNTYIKDHVNPLNLFKFSKGLYFVEVTINNRKKIISVIVQ